MYAALIRILLLVLSSFCKQNRRCLKTQNFGTNIINHAGIKHVFLDTLFANMAVRTGLTPCFERAVVQNRHATSYQEKNICSINVREKARKKCGWGGRFLRSSSCLNTFSADGLGINVGTENDVIRKTCQFEPHNLCFGITIRKM